MYKYISTKSIKDSEFFDSETEMAIVDENDLAIEIGGNIAEARIARGFTQVDLAKKMNTFQSSIARVERGNKLPTNKFLLRVANALETSLIAPSFACIEENIEAMGSVPQNVATDTYTYSELFKPWASSQLVVCRTYGEHFGFGVAQAVANDIPVLLPV